ncbi:hypothetical protein ACIQRS_10915 [Streptomyces termitum]|uniref:Uncharacterized protein n=1 Tax=Streptomyces termitum TaxID=67368 RepID=A0A918SS13_9ACTN|nr:hypothetical protein [Streptomyces termitum]GHA69108.1 hypothetical protein GCM10010305_09060 [Streptomyces termitum]
MERLHTAPAFGGGIPPRSALRPVHLSVLGGRTLNVAVPAPPSAGVSAARLELVRGRSAHRLPLEAEPQADGSLLLTATTALSFTDGPPARKPGPDRAPAESPGRDADRAPAEAPAEGAGPAGSQDTGQATGEAAARGPGRPGLPLSAGLWRLAVVLTGADGGETRTGVAAVGLPAADGPVAPVSPDPVRGALFRLMRSVDGFAVLRVRPPAHQAELDTFALRWDRVTVRGRLIAPRGPAASYTAQAVRRGGGAVVGAPVEWDGDTFAFDLPLATMAARKGGRWDVQLQRGRTGLRIARRLTDLRRRDQVIRTSFRIVALADGSLLRVHAYITPAGALAVSCAAFEGAPGGAEERV